MADRLSDVFIYEVYQSYKALNGVTTTEFYDAGVLANNPLLDSLARGPGKSVTMPFWLDLDPTIEPDYTNGDPEDMAVPSWINDAEMVARKAFMHKAWTDMDLTTELTGSDPMSHIRDRFGNWWKIKGQERLIATSQGIVADNIANDASDMGLDISGGSADAAIFNRDAFVRASFTMGDRTGGLKAIAVHSAVAARMTLNDEIVFMPDSSGKLLIPTYMGARVIIDDSMPKTGSGADTIYTSILFGGSAFGFGGVEGQAVGYGEGTPRKPAYVERIELAGNGGGQEIVGERKTWIIHPFGFSWVEAGAALTEFSPTLADLRLAAHWNRVVPRKNVPMAWIKSKA